MVLQRFNAMHEKEEAQRREAREARERALDEQEGTPLLLDDGGGGMAAGGGGSPDRRVSIRPEGGESPNAQPLPREPLARRRERQRRLAEEQRKRIAEEEREKQTADATIRKLQARRRPAWPPSLAALPSRPALSPSHSPPPPLSHVSHPDPLPMRSSSSPTCSRRTASCGSRWRRASTTSPRRPTRSRYTTRPGHSASHAQIPAAHPPLLPLQDMEFQTTSVRTQKENALAVISGEITYLNEHQITVQRKSSELSGKMAEAEASIAAAGHKLQRVEHANEMATADLRRDNEVLTDEARVLASRFEQLTRDVRQLYQDKQGLLAQQKTAAAETADVENTVKQYRGGLQDMLDV